MNAEQVRQVGAALWPDASEPAIPAWEFDHEPELYLDHEDPERYEVLGCSCGTELARIPKGGGWRTLFEEHLRRCGI